MKCAVLCFVALALTGCFATGMDPSKMSADQLKAMAADKNAQAVCVSGKTAAGNVTTTFASLDKGVVSSGTMTIDADCRVTITAGPKVSVTQ